MRWAVAALLLAGCAAAPAPETPTPTPTVAAVPEVQLGMTPLPPEDLDIPVYPGARRVGGGALQPQTRKEAVLATLDYETDDPLGTVEAFYQKRLKDASPTRVKQKGYELVTLSTAHDHVTISRTEGQPTRINLVRQR